MKYLLATILSFSLYLAYCKEKPRYPIVYSLTIKPAKGYADVSVKFRGNEAGRTKFIFPREWGGLINLQRGISIRTVTGVRKYEFENDSSTVILYHKPGEKLKVGYRLYNAVREQVPANEDAYCPIINIKYFHLIGNTFIAYPHLDSTKEYDFQISLINKSPLTSLSSFGSEQNYRLTSTIEEFQSLLWVGGDFRMYRMMIHDRPLLFAIRGIGILRIQRCSNMYIKQ